MKKVSEDIKIIKELRVSGVQAKKSVRKANPDRQYGDGAYERFRTHASEIVDLFAQFIEQEMKVAPKGGAGCRVQKKDINASFGKFYQAIREFMDSQPKNPTKVVEKVVERVVAKNFTVDTALKEKNRKLAKELKELKEKLGEEE